MIRCLYCVESSLPCSARCDGHKRWVYIEETRTRGIIARVKHAAAQRGQATYVFSLAAHKVTPRYASDAAWIAGVDRCLQDRGSWGTPALFDAVAIHARCCTRTVASLE